MNSQEKNISYSAPGKVILSGEHAVVYGKPALVCAIDQRLRFTLWKRPSQNVNLNNKDKNILLIADIVKNYLKNKKIKITCGDFDFEIKSQIPLGRGLGSSAALSVAAVASFLRFYTGKNFEKEIINNIAYEVEKHFHKNPSGVDNTASCFGGLIYYRREFEFLKNISLLSFKIPQIIEKNLFLIDSGPPFETTGQMVEFVGKRYNKKPDYIEQIFNDIEKVTKRMVVAIIKEDVNFFQQAILDNQILLEMLGVVSKKTKAMLTSLNQYGIGKITGAGGKKKDSGFILFFATKRKALENFLNKKRLKYYKFKTYYYGLQ